MPLHNQKGARVMGARPKGVDMSMKKQPQERTLVGNRGGSAAQTKTPLFEASNALRYARQTLIKEIESRCGCALICYVAGRSASIESDDTMGFVDLLHNVERGKNLDLL